MKRLLILSLLAVFVLGAGMANAATTLKTNGEMAFGYQWLDNPDFFSMDDDNTSEDDFQVYQRVRIYFDWSASESLRAVVGLEIGASNWGVSGGGADLDSDDVAVEVKRAYLDFAWPNTGLNFRMGVQGVTLPGAVAGSPIFDGDVAGILASYEFNDMVSATFGWLRLQDSDAGADTGGRAADGVNDEIDALALLVPMKGDGWTFTPWALYAIVGQNSTNDANGVVGLAYNGLINNNTGALSDNMDAWWVGAAYTLDMFAPFSIKADLIYGATDGANGSESGGVGERSGWFFDASVDYKMDMVTPGMFFMYSSGEDDDNSDSERIPTLYGWYGLTSLGMAGASGGGILDGFADGVLTNDATMGMWVLGGKLAGFSFVDKLSHTLLVAYGQGTTDADFVKKGYATQNAGYNNYNAMAYLTEKDSFWEVNLDSQYAIYENLTAFVELGYLNLDLDDMWKTHSHNLGVQDTDKAEDVWKLAIALVYSF